jgi:hypothetical protein
VLLVLAAGWWVFVFVVGRIGTGIPSFDIYASSYPNIVYALRSLRYGHGFFWNPFQNCGQPFPPATAISAFYPLNLVFLGFDADRGLIVIAFVHLALAAVGTYTLCREIGLGRAAALCGAISFELGYYLPAFALWHPVPILGSLVWLPWALLWCERGLRAPNLRAGLWLGIVLALSLLAAFPQNTLFIYQVILLRMMWEVTVRRRRAVLNAAGVLTLGLLLAPAMGAVQLLPASEFAVRSVRGHQLQLGDLAPYGLLDWTALRKVLATRDYPIWLGWPAPIVFAALTPLAFVTRATRRQALFYAIVCALFVALAIDGPVLRLYLSLPLGGTFRMPSRFLWVAGFGACMLTALGAEAIVHAPADARLRLPLLVLLGAGALWLLGGTRPPRQELWALAGLALVAAFASRPHAGDPPGLTAAGVVLVVAGLMLYAAQLPKWLTYADGAALLAPMRLS